jgi:hypothetical protein
MQLERDNSKINTQARARYVASVAYENARLLLRQII